MIISLLLAVAVGGFWLAGAGARTEEESAAVIDSAVEATYPGESELDVRQARIGVDLQSGYTADLTIDGIQIPEDELQRVESLGIVYYLPDPSRTTGALEPGRHCAQAFLWQPTRGKREDVGRTFSWCFHLH